LTKVQRRSLIKYFLLCLGSMLVERGYASSRMVALSGVSAFDAPYIRPLLRRGITLQPITLSGRTYLARGEWIIGYLSNPSVAMNAQTAYRICDCGTDSNERTFVIVEGVQA
jgi:hypothetical protein